MPPTRHPHPVATPGDAPGIMTFDNIYVLVWGRGWSRGIASPLQAMRQPLTLPSGVQSALGFAETRRYVPAQQVQPPWGPKGNKR